MDIWRISPTGGAPERITNHDSLVSHPVFLDARTLLYLASDSDGSGPWIYSLDVERRISHRVSVGIDRYTSLAASLDGRRLVATQAGPKGTLWRLPITGTRAETSAARRIPLTTSSGSSPRLGADYLLYVSSKGASDSIWKLQGDVAIELWSAAQTRIIGGPAIARDGRRIAFSIRQQGQTLLCVTNADGTDARVVTRSLELQGAPAWAPDGQSVTVAAIERRRSTALQGPPRRRFAGAPGARITPSIRRGRLTAISSCSQGQTSARRFRSRRVTADLEAYPLPTLTLTRGARHVAFMPGRRAFVVMKGRSPAQGSLADRCRHRRRAPVDQSGCGLRDARLRHLSRRASTRAGAGATAFRHRAARGTPAMTRARSRTLPYGRRPTR